MNGFVSKCVSQQWQFCNGSNSNIQLVSCVFPLLGLFSFEMTTYLSLDILFHDVPRFHSRVAITRPAFLFAVSSILLFFTHHHHIVLFGTTAPSARDLAFTENQIPLPFLKVSPLGV
jgi:hypothetical protein